MDWGFNYHHEYCFVNICILLQEKQNEAYCRDPNLAP